MAGRGSAAAAAAAQRLARGQLGKQLGGSRDHAPRGIGGAGLRRQGWIVPKPWGSRNRGSWIGGWQIRGWQIRGCGVCQLVGPGLGLGPKGLEIAAHLPIFGPELQAQALKGLAWKRPDLKALPQPHQGGELQGEEAIGHAVAKAETDAHQQGELPAGTGAGASGGRNRGHASILTCRRSARSGRQRRVRWCNRR